jgi:hypothetical protein
LNTRSEFKISITATAFSQYQLHHHAIFSGSIQMLHHPAIFLIDGGIITITITIDEMMPLHFIQDSDGCIRNPSPGPIEFMEL